MAAIDRAYDGGAQVALPNLSTDDFVGLATQLVTLAQAERLPRTVAEALDDLDRARDGARGALLLKHAAPGVDPQEARRCDVALDRSWSALRDMVSGWRKRPEGSHADEAAVAELEALLFPQGLDFLSLAFRAEWSASSTRLEILARPAQRELASRLGLADFVADVRRAHEAYGRALGMSEALPAAAPDVDVRAALDELREATRDYVLAVSGSARRKDARSRARAERLLAPFGAAVTRAGTGSGAPEPGDAPPAPPAPP